LMGYFSSPRLLLQPRRRSPKCAEAASRW
jgi:hypothetical protein